MADESIDNEERLTAEEEARLRAVDSELDFQARRSGTQSIGDNVRHLRPASDTEPEAPRKEPYSMINRPIIRAQINLARIKHEGWEEEWYVHVPGTEFTWKRDIGVDKPRVIKSFESASEAERFAQEAWRKRWADKVQEHAVVDVLVQKEFTVDEHSPKDLEALENYLNAHPEGLPLDVVIHRKNAVPQAAPALSSRLSSEDPREEIRRGWLADESAFRGKRVPSGVNERSRALGPGSRVLVSGSQDWKNEDKISDLIYRLPSTATIIHRGNPGAEAIADKLARERGLRVETVSEHKSRFRRDVEALNTEPTSVFSFRNPGQVDASDNLVRLSRLKGVPTNINGVWSTPLSADAKTSLNRWIKEGRQMVEAARHETDINDPASVAKYRRFAHAATIAVTEVMPPDGTLAVHPDRMRRALEDVISWSDTYAADIHTKAVVWGDSAEALTADSLEIFRAGRISDDVARELSDGVVSGLAASSLSGATLDATEMYTTRTPSGKFIAWSAAKEGDLEDAPTPRSVYLRLHENLDEVQDLAYQRGASVTVMNRPEVIEMWKQKAEDVFGEERAGRIIERAMKAPDTPEVKEPPQNLVAQERGKRPPEEWYIAPWGKGRAVLWTLDRADGKPRFAKSSGDGLGVLKPGDNAKPLIVETVDPGGYTKLTKAATKKWGNVTPADLPEHLAHKLVSRYKVAPKEPSLPDDAIWHVTPHPRRSEAYAWAYVPVVEESGGEARLKQVGSLLQWSGMENPERFEAPDRLQAVSRAMEELKGAGLVCVKSRGTPFEVADRVLDITDPQLNPARKSVQPSGPDMKLKI